MFLPAKERAKRTNYILMLPRHFLTFSPFLSVFPQKQVAKPFSVNYANSCLNKTQRSTKPLKTNKRSLDKQEISTSYDNVFQTVGPGQTQRRERKGGKKAL